MLYAPALSRPLSQCSTRFLFAFKMSTSSALPPSPFPLLTTVRDFRAWRRKAYDEKKAVGFVPTMGALHEGHLTLVRRSLAENDLTVVSIFVNPAQFAPHEDLATYPRTLPNDIVLLSETTLNVPRSIEQRMTSAIFLPSVKEMYPSGITQDVAEQTGTFVEVKGYGHQMEGASRPTFFRGVATVVTKLFNIIEPTNAYFGQKDIQQCFLLRRLTRDLLLSHPDPEHLHIIPTARDSIDGLALSSRNAYLTAEGREVAPTLFQALKAAESAWDAGFTVEECIQKAVDLVEAKKAQAQLQKSGVVMKLDYIQMNNSQTFDNLKPQSRKGPANSELVILSGALWVDKTRLIDNLILQENNIVFGQ